MAEEVEETEESGALISPVGLVMFSIAVILDIVGVIMLLLYLLFGIGIAGSFVLDIIGLIIIGGWMFLRSGRIKVTKGAASVLKRLGLTFLGELIPVVGDIGFCWTVLVYYELKNG